jgi:TIR domain
MSDKWDVFICHASEDKDSFVRPLAVALQSLNVSVWYDEFSLKPGDSISRSIDKGIGGSAYGLVVISPAFISKAWTEHELRGLVSREIAQDAVIIPIWHGVKHRDVLEFSPPLADKRALNTADLNALDVALQILRVVRPDLYKQHPRAELARIASGEAIADLQEDLESTKEELARFQCPTCGAPLVETVRVDHEYGDYMIEVFECGFELDGRTPCPSDPDFPKFEEYDLRMEHHPKETYWKWICYPTPRTHNARRLDLPRGVGRTEEEAKKEVFERHRRAARPWPNR